VGTFATCDVGHLAACTLGTFAACCGGHLCSLDVAHLCSLAVGTSRLVRWAPCSLYVGHLAACTLGTLQLVAFNILRLVRWAPLVVLVWFSFLFVRSYGCLNQLVGVVRYSSSGDSRSGRQLGRRARPLRLAYTMPYYLRRMDVAWAQPDACFVIGRVGSP
jgi:hypothetical protein